MNLNRLVADGSDRLRTRCCGHRRGGRHRKCRSPVPTRVRCPVRPRRRPGGGPPPGGPPCSWRTAGPPGDSRRAALPVTRRTPCPVVLAALRPVTSIVPATMIGGRPSSPQDNDWRGRFRDAPWGDGLPPWGWGATAGCQVRMDRCLPAWGPPPPPVNYWGYDEQPVWDPGYNQWGFYFFGIWIPLLASDRRPGETAASDTPGRSSTFQRSE